ncbi:MAG: tripartite tricarboxylate transporter substrate binding protein [Xanthobacteraceae bacterium]|nr:tripartite tricarboxylate transporter substrate binding protein [Xanthobacteraceae bacterium]
MGLRAMRSVLALLSVLALSAMASEARAQGLPSGPLKIVTSVGAGAAPDVITRLVAEHLTRLWGHQVIVINQPGGAGAVAIKAVSSAPSDGSTLYMALATNFIALPELQKNFPVDVLHDFAPVGFIGEQPIMIGAAPSLGIGTLPELIALLKQRPGELNIGGGNRGSILHFTGEWLRSASGTKFTLLHYAGGAQALPDLMGGRLQATIDAIASMRGAIDGGQVRPLAVTVLKRLDNFPQVPTVAETLPGFQSMGWMALMAPAGTPAPVVKKISDDLRTVLAKPELKQRLADLGTYVRPTTPEELTAFIREQQAIWRPVIAETAKQIN